MPGDPAICKVPGSYSAPPSSLAVMVTPSLWVHSANAVYLLSSASVALVSSLGGMVSLHLIWSVSPTPLTEAPELLVLCAVFPGWLQTQIVLCHLRPDSWESIANTSTGDWSRALRAQGTYRAPCRSFLFWPKSTPPLLFNKPHE